MSKVYVLILRGTDLSSESNEAAQGEEVMATFLDIQQAERYKWKLINQDRNLWWKPDIKGFDSSPPETNK